MQDLLKFMLSDLVPNEPGESGSDHPISPMVSRNAFLMFGGVFCMWTGILHLQMVVFRSSQAEDVYRIISLLDIMSHLIQDTRDIRDKLGHFSNLDAFV